MKAALLICCCSTWHQVDAENRKKELEKAVKKAEAELAEAQKTLDELIKVFFS
jgi:hypothetical protein